MDNIWYRNPSKSEVIGRCGGDEKNEWPRRNDKKYQILKFPLLQLGPLVCVIRRVESLWPEYLWLDPYVRNWMVLIFVEGRRERTVSHSLLS